ncbi:MAG TPA: nucleotide exchange factor GrpE [Streptosporangiaceae bacterium]
MSSAHTSPSDNGAVPAAFTRPTSDAEIALSDGLAAVQATLERLSALTEREHERAAHREAVIDRLHDDNQMLRRGELQAMLDPVRTALYRLHDMVRRESGRWAAPDRPDAVHAAPLLAAIADEIADALARTGAERLAVEPGERFDPVRHRPVDTAPVTDLVLDGAVVAVRADGFGQGEQILRRAEVVIGQIADAAPAPPRLNASAESI